MNCKKSIKTIKPIKLVIKKTKPVKKVKKKKVNNDVWLEIKRQQFIDEYGWDGFCLDY